MVPAKMFRTCISQTHSRCKLGLTATLVREDNLIEDLFYMIGMRLLHMTTVFLSHLITLNS
jgi:DNA excision repair protein ERCC-3